MNNKDRNFKIIIPLLIILLFFWFLLTFRITQVPPGINGDEAAIGYNAALVARTGQDQNGRHFPLFVSVFDLTDWKQPVTFYSTVLAFKIFGPSYSILREVSDILAFLPKGGGMIIGLGIVFLLVDIVCFVISLRAARQQS